MYAQAELRESAWSDAFRARLLQVAAKIKREFITHAATIIWACLFYAGTKILARITGPTGSISCSASRTTTFLASATALRKARACY